jgi:hypothetical protein
MTLPSPGGLRSPPSLRRASKFNAEKPPNLHNIYPTNSHSIIKIKSNRSPKTSLFNSHNLLAPIP